MSSVKDYHQIDCNLDGNEITTLVIIGVKCLWLLDEFHGLELDRIQAYIDDAMNVKLVLNICKIR